MFKLDFKYNILPFNINKVFIDDFKIIKNIRKIGYKIEEANYNFDNNIRILTYKCKNQKTINKLISLAKLSRIKTLTGEYHAV